MAKTTKPTAETKPKAAKKKASSKKKLVKKAAAKKVTTTKATPKKAPPKKATPKTAEAKKATVKKSTPKKGVGKKTVAPKKPVKQISAQQRHDLVAQAAYLRSESQGFFGDAAADWLAAETEVDARLVKAGIKVKG